MSEQCSALIDRIIVLRKAKGLSQKELSARCGMIADALGAKLTICSVE